MARATSGGSRDDAICPRPHASSSRPTLSSFDTLLALSSTSTARRTLRRMRSRCRPWRKAHPTWTCTVSSPKVTTTALSRHGHDASICSMYCAGCPESAETPPGAFHSRRPAHSAHARELGTLSPPSPTTSSSRSITNVSGCGPSRGNPHCTSFSESSRQPSPSARAAALSAQAPWRPSPAAGPAVRRAPKPKLARGPSRRHGGAERRRRCEHPELTASPPRHVVAIPTFPRPPSVLESFVGVGKIAFVETEAYSAQRATCSFEQPRRGHLGTTMSCGKSARTVWCRARLCAC